MSRIPLSLLLLLALAAPLHASEPESAADHAKALAEAMESEDADARAQAAKDACKNTEATLTSPLIRLLKDDVLAVRLAAMEALATRTDKTGKRKAASALLAHQDRVGKDPARMEECEAALRALRPHATTSALKPLLKGVTKDTPIALLDARLNAVAWIPHASAIESLIDLLAQGRRRGESVPIKGAAVRALRVATGNDGRGLGVDPDRWRAWWRDAKAEFDFEAVAATRRTAGQGNGEDREDRAGRRRRNR